MQGQKYVRSEGGNQVSSRSRQGYTCRCFGDDGDKNDRLREMYDECHCRNFVPSFFSQIRQTSVLCVVTDLRRIIDADYYTALRLNRG